MDHSTIIFILQLLVLIGAFVFGKYVKPNIPAETFTDMASKFEIIVAWAEKFVAWAAYFKKDKTGKEKMEAVISELRDIADKYGIEITDNQLKAIAQAAYDQMIKGENKENIDLGSLISVIGSIPKAEDKSDEIKPVPLPVYEPPKVERKEPDLVINADDIINGNITVPKDMINGITFYSNDELNKSEDESSDSAESTEIINPEPEDEVDPNKDTITYSNPNGTVFITGNNKNGFFDQDGNRIP